MARNSSDTLLMNFDPIFLPEFPMKSVIDDVKLNVYGSENSQFGAVEFFKIYK